jgi:flagellar motor protein MotB
LHEEEESYFASMTDVFIGLLFVFIIMLVFFAMRFQDATAAQQREASALKDAKESQEKVIKQLEEATAAREKAAERQNELVNDLTDSETARAAILRQMAGFLQQKGISVTVIENEGVLRLPEEILFSRSKWELNQKGLEAVKAVAEALDQVLPCYTMGLRSISDGCPQTKAKVEAIFIEGHADADPYRPPSPVEPRRATTAPQPGTSAWSPFSGNVAPQAEQRPASAPIQYPPRDNLDLSTLRATGTFRELLKAKQELTQYRSPAQKPILSVSGYGDHRQVDHAPGESPEQFKMRNRRIDLRVLMAAPRSEDAKNLERELNSELHR